MYLNMQLTTCCFFTCAHFRRVPETVHPVAWCERRPYPRDPRLTWHLPASISWSYSWARSWSDPWSNSHPGSRPGPWPNTRSGSRTNSRSSPSTDPHNSRTNSRANSRTTTYTASSTRYTPASCLCFTQWTIEYETSLRVWKVKSVCKFILLQYTSGGNSTSFKKTCDCM